MRFGSQDFKTPLIACSFHVMKKKLLKYCGTSNKGLKQKSMMRTQNEIIFNESFEYDVTYAMRSYSITTVTRWVNEAACCGQDGVALQQHFNQTVQRLQSMIHSS